MITPTVEPEKRATLLDEILTEAATRSSRNRQTRRRLPGGGTLFIDGRTPFLAVYRTPEEMRDPGGARFAKALRSYLVLPAGGEEIGRRVCGDLGHAFVEDVGVALVIELWVAAPDLRGDEGGLPAVTIHVPSLDPKVEAAFRSELSNIRVLPSEEAAPGMDRAEVTTRRVESPGPPGRPALLTDDALVDRIHWVGIEIPSTFREGGAVYPARMFLILRTFTHALERAIYTWAVPRMTVKLPGGRQALGRQNLGRTERAIDGRLAAVAEAFDLVLGASPVNGGAMWDEFERSGQAAAPRFEYRPLHFDPEALKRSLFQVPLERIEDPLVAELIREKQEELDLRISMLRSRGTEEFFFGSLQLFGMPDPTLVELAHDLLARSGGSADATDADEVDAEADRERVDATAFARRARSEIDAYRRAHPEFPDTIEMRDDISSGLLVSDGRLCIRRTLLVAPDRVDALIQHEIGTHVLTYFNGSRQPLRLLASGLAYYGALQEGLAVLAEHLVGGLTRGRLRTLAARVAAVEARVERADFVEAHRRLVGLGLPARTAFSIVVRVYRGGGLTKDAQYLRGLRDILEYLRDGGALETLFLGKLGFTHLSTVRELRARGIATGPAVMPRYTLEATAVERLDQCRGTTVLELFEEARP